MRFSDLLKPDNLVLSFFSAVFDMVLLSLLTVVCAAPVVSAGAALTAMHYVLFHKVQGDGIGVVQPYFRAVKENFMQATGLWLILGGMATALIVAIRRQGAEGNVLVWGGIVFLSVLFLEMAVYVFPLQARYANSISRTLRLALQIAMASLPRATAMVILIVGYGFFLYNVPPRHVPLALVFGLAPVNALCVRLYAPVLTELEEQRKEY